MLGSTMFGPLPHDIWSMIVQELKRPLPKSLKPRSNTYWKDLHQQDLTVVIRLNSDFYRIVTPVLYTTVVTESIPKLLYGLFPEDNPKDTYNRLSYSKQDLLLRIKNLYIEGEDFDESEERSSAGRPYEGVGEAPYPTGLVENLRYRTEALEKLMWHRNQMGGDTFQLDRLAVAAFESWYENDNEYATCTFQQRLALQQEMNLVKERASAIKPFLLSLFPAKWVCQGEDQWLFDLTSCPSDSPVKYEGVSIHEMVGTARTYPHSTLRLYHHFWAEMNMENVADAQELADAEIEILDLDLHEQHREAATISGSSSHEVIHVITRPRWNPEANLPDRIRHMEDQYQDAMRSFCAGRSISEPFPSLPDGYTITCKLAKDVDPCPACGYVEGAIEENDMKFTGGD